MQKMIALGIAALFMLAAVPSVQADRVEHHSYIPGAVVVTVWCSEAEHSIVPIGNPDEYGRNESDPLDPVTSAEGWLFSGEPECAPHDVYNTYQTDVNGGERSSGGYGGAAFTVQDGEKLSKLTANTDDDFFGVGASYIILSARTTEVDPDSPTGAKKSEVSEGCGPQSITIPDTIENHWQSSESNPLYLSWARIRTAMVDAEDLTVCFSSTGMISGTFSAA